MTPLYNSNDYYKKMLELQERLRKSEEERIRLEERFSLLEHESRSRHETCINRLRMRYIDFLEEQQARDERNHQLLGALDRVDSSLALMTAKTDRLGALRKQYEASMLARHENRRPNGSVTGDSGVASQNDEGHRRCLESYRGVGNVGLASSRSKPLGDKGKSNETRNSTSQVRPVSSYGSNWTGIRCENSQMYQPSLAFSRLSQGIVSSVRGNGLSASFNGVDHSTRFLGAKTPPEARESIFQRLRYADVNSPGSSSGDYRKNDPPHYGGTSYSLRRIGTDPVQNLKYRRSVVRDLAASGAYDSVDPVPRSFNSAPGHFRDSYERTSITRNSPKNNLDNVLHRNSNSPDSNPVSNLEDRKILSSSSRSPKLCDILRQELGDEEEHIGHIVENQLERYISKIRSLHRVAEPQSLEEIDHEQNTSGDLLNVTLSDDGLDLPVEDKPRDRLMRQDLGNVLALASDLANKTATNAINVANNMYENVSAGDEIKGNDMELNVVLNRERNNNDEEIIVPEADDQLASINRLLDQTESHENENVSGNEKHESLAKNGISGNVAKACSELASRPTKNIRNVAKLIRSSEDTDQGKYASERIGANPVNEDESTCFNSRIVSQVPEDKSDKFSRRSSSLNLLEVSQYKLANGEERENDENLHDVLEDLEPWNLSALERRVQEIILNDEAQDGFVKKEIGREADSTSRSLEHEHEDLAIEEEIVEPEANNEEKMDELFVGNKGALGVDNSWENNAESEEGTKNQEDPMPQEHQRSFLVPTDGLNIELPKTPGILEEVSVEDINYGSVNDASDPNVNYEPNQTDVNYTNRENSYPDNSTTDYGYNENGQYQDTDQQYPHYNPNDGVQYDGDQVQQYGYPEEQYLQDPNQQNYVQDPNEQNYVEDPNEQNYIQDPNQQIYVESSNEENYVQDPNQQNYMQDPNQQDYVQDPNHQNYVEDPNQQDYVQDPNQQEWIQESNQQYDTEVNQQFTQDPDQQYEDDPNQQYSVDPEQQYSADPNDQYLANQQYPENEQYDAQSNEVYSDQIDSDKPYVNTDDYVQGMSEEYPVPISNNPYPKAEGYPGVHEDSAVPNESPENLQHSPERSTSLGKSSISPKANAATKKTKDVIKSILDSDTDTTIEKNASNTESDFDFN